MATSRINASTGLPRPQTEWSADDRPGLAEASREHQSEDVALLAKVGARDRRAFAEIYERFAGPLFSLAVRILRCHAEAEDVLQDAFVVIWTRAGAYRPELGTPFGWAVAIVRHRAIDCLRARSRHLEFFAQDLAAHNGAVETPTAAAALEELDGNRVVRSVLAPLRGDELRVIDLAFFGGLTQGEIAGALVLPLGTVKARIRRGMLKLSQMPDKSESAALHPSQA